jgi:hypothetical protein
MYLGIDFLAGSNGRPYGVDVNLGLPGGATEIDRIHRVRHGRPSDIFSRIERISAEVYGRTFSAYLESLPFLASLKRFKLWMDGSGERPGSIPPLLRLEDKWVQCQVLRDIARMPATEPYQPGDEKTAASFFSRFHPIVLKPRLGRHGRGFIVLKNLSELLSRKEPGPPSLLQEYLESRLGGYAFSIRALVFGGRVLGMHASLGAGNSSSEGTIADVVTGPEFALSGSVRDTVHFEEKTWEAELWFPEETPAYLHTNLYEDDVTRATAVVPAGFAAEMAEVAVKIERVYERLNPGSLPRACFDE